MTDIDVIAQFNRDGSIIPLRVRFEDEDGEEQSFTLKEYEIVKHGTGNVGGLFVKESDLVWKCTLAVLGVQKTIWLSWNGKRWMMGLG